VPEGVSVIKINPQNGQIAEDSGVPEYFYQEFPPPAQSMWGDESGNIPTGKSPDEIKDQLF
jgi:hypothetical protein